MVHYILLTQICEAITERARATGFYLLARFMLNRVDLLASHRPLNFMLIHAFK